MEIWKFPLEIVEYQSVAMPEWAELLHIEFHRGELNLWALVNPNEPKVQCTIHRFGTGWPMPDNLGLKHIGTVLDGAYVWHFFEEVDS